jgi:hypothetical protein
VVVGEPGGGAAGGGPAGRVLGRLLGQVEVKGNGAVARPRRHRRHVVRVDGPHAVDGGAHGHVGVGGGHPLGPTRPPLDVAVAEAALDGVEGRVFEAGAEVAGVEQHEPDAGLPGRLADGVVHAGGVMEVVELVDGRDAGQQQLAEGGGGERQ